MLSVLLLLQATRFLQPAPEADAALLTQGAAYQDRLQEIGATAAVERDRLATLRPDTAAEREVVLHLLLEGDARVRRLAVLLASGASPGASLARGCAHLGARSTDPAERLGALLAPTGFAPAQWPALAWIALDPRAGLAVRAAAIGRLLEAGCPHAWPLARSVLRTGTSLDEDAPWATWERTGRYELAKRTLMISVRRWLEERGIEAPPFEPNAAWAVQEQQLAPLEEAASRARAGVEPSADRELARGIEGLFQAARAGERRALDAIAVLHPHSAERTGAALRSGNLASGRLARAVIDRIPH